MSVIDEISPKKFCETVARGARRLSNFKSARIQFVKEYVGSYYDAKDATVGGKAINLIFNAIRVLLPTMVMNFPKHTVMTPYLQSREYANLLGLALDQHDMKIDIRGTYRKTIVDAIFTLGILKTGLAQSDSVYVFDDDMGQESVDNGTIYTDSVDFDNFVVDPSCKDFMFRDATFMGDKISVPRKMLLDSGLYRNDLVERIARGDENIRANDLASDQSMRNIDKEENAELQDCVEIYEIWVPSANAIVTIAADKDVQLSEYLRVTDYYGVKEGPYTLLALTPPVPGNPLPVPMVGVWYDLHILANRMAKKIIEQAERQKDVVVYKPNAADDAEELKDAGDGEAVKVDDPDSVKTLSFGGQQNSNENHLQSLENWFNMMAGNPAQVGGQNIEAHSATAANILQQNSGIGLEDMKDMVYQMAAGEARRRSFFFHTDPLMKIPLTKRQPVMAPVPGAEWMIAPQMQDIQTILTPEQRSGDFLDYTFTIEPESMGRIDSKVRLQQEMAFAQQVIPAVATAAQVFMGLGIPFDALAFMTRMAKDMGITWLDEVIYSPQLQQQLLMQRMAGPQDPGKAQGQPQQPNPGLGGGLGQILQNGQPGVVRAPPPGPQEQQNQSAQAGANDSQTLIRTALRSAFRPTPAPKVASLT
jgi:hypothetical protein